MKRVIKIVIMVLVFGFAVVLASSCCGIQTVAYADGYELYLINNPLDISLYQYSTNGVDYYDISGSLTDFVDTFYNGITHTEPLQLFIGSEGVPLVTAETITISKDTEGYIYLENDFASTVPPQEFNRDVTIAMRSAIILSADADLTVNQALITTDGARAITQRSTGTLTVNGLSDSTVIHSINRAVPTYGGTIFVDYVASALPAYVQNGGSILNSADHAYSSAILNYSNRDLYINGGNVVSTPSGNPFAEYGMGETAAIRNVSDGVIYISETPGNPTVIASANASVYYMGVIHLSGVATGKTTLDISGGTIINYNQNSTYAKRCYAIYTVNPNNISISDATVTNMGGYAINNAGQGDITIQNSTIDNSAMSFNIPAIYMPGGVLDIAESTVSSAAYYAAAIQADTGNVYLDNATIEGASDTYGCLHLGSGNLRVTDTVLVNESQVKMYFSAAENNLLFDDFSIIGNFNVNIKMIDDDISTPTDQKSYSIGAVDNTYSDKYFRAWYEDSAHYSDSAEIDAASLPIGALLRIHVENVYQFIQDPDMQHGSLFAHTPIKTFKGLTVNLVFRPDTAYYLHEAYYYDATEQKVAIYLHSGDNYTETPYIEAVMPEGDHTVYADFRPVPITVSVNDIIAIYGDNIRLWANINAYDGVNYSYIWYREGNEITGQTSNNLQLFDVDESGNYSVRVTSDLEGANTAEDTAIATILPKSVVTQWSEVTVFQYSGTDQYPTATAYDLQSNPLTLLYNGVSHLVGRHTLTVSTTNNNYILSGSTIEYDITPLTTTIVWSNLEFVYDGESHKPTAYAEDVIGNPLNIVVSGAESEASELPYTAHATTADGSYVFANADQEFIVMPEEVSVQWYFQYTDTQKEIFFYNGYDQLMRVQAYFLNIYDYRVDLQVSVTGMTNGDNVFKLPDTYQVTVEFITPAPNYSLSSDSRQLVMQKAKPLISVPQNSFEFVYDGNAHSIVANVLYADTIIYLLNDSEVLNSFIEPGVYAVTLTTREDNLHDKAADVAVTVTVLATTAELKDEEGNIISTLYHANGIDPNAELVCSLQNNITPEMNKNYTDYWGRSVLTLIQLSLDGTEDTTLQGASTVRIQLDETVISNRVLKLRCLQDGKVTELAYTLDEEGYLEFEASLPGEYAIVGTSGTNSIIGISVFVIVGIAIVSSLIVFLVRRKKSVY